MGKVLQKFSATAVQGLRQTRVGQGETGLGRALGTVYGMALASVSIIALPIVGIAYLFGKRQ